MGLEITTLSASDLRGIQGALGIQVDVKSYGAVGDARKVTDAVLNGTNTVTSASAPFTAADVGKVIWGSYTDGSVMLTKRTIASYVNASTVTFSGATTTSQTGIQLVWGTDDTTAIQAAGTAADALSPKGAVIFPQGGYVFSDRLFNQTYSIGTDTYPIYGNGQVVLYPTPDHALTGGVVFNTSSNAQRGHIEGIHLDGAYVTFTGSPFTVDAPANSTWRNVQISNVRGISSLTRVAGSNNRFYGCHWEGSSYVGILVSGYAEFLECYSGNHGYISVQGSSGRIHWIGGTLDECAGPTIYAANGVVKVANAIVYGGISQNCIELAGTATLYAMNAEIIPFSTNNNVTGLNVGASAIAYLTQCKLGGSGTGYGLNNAGTVYDGGNNVSNTKTGAGTIDATLAL